MPLPQANFIDYDKLYKDLVADGLGLMLPEFGDKCLLRQFFAAFLEEAQELHTAIIDLIKARSLGFATGEWLDGLGRIVGVSRVVFDYDDTVWLFADRPKQPTDTMPVWCTNALWNTQALMDDEQYRLQIWFAAVRGSVKTASVPEVQRAVWELLATKVSYIKVGPNQVSLFIAVNITVAQYTWLTQFRDTSVAQYSPYVPYPVTLSLDKIYWPLGDVLFLDGLNQAKTDKSLIAVESHVSQEGYA